MTWYRVGPAGIPGNLKTDMDAVLNKKFGTSTTYAPNTWPDNVNLLGPLPEKTASGAIAHIEDGADGVPVKNWLVTLPASLDGYTEVNGTKAGKNLAIGGVYEYNARNMIIAPVYLRASIYTVSFNRGVNVQYIYIRKGETVSLVGDAYATKSNSTFFTFTADEDTYYYAQLYRTNTSDTWEDYPVTQPQIEVGSTATAYEPYEAPTQYTASLGRTIYGGTADIVTGEGEETYKGYNLGALTWAGGIIGGNMWCWYVDLSADGLKLPANSAIFDGICNDYTPIRFNGISSNANTIALRSNGYLYVNNGSDTIEPTGNVTIALDAPETFTFTPITPTPETALGVNNFWADEGDSDVTYRADISLALQAINGGRGLMGMMMQRPEEEQLTEEDPEEQPEETETNER